ncbi:MAG: ester cyclase, partial [Chloroflexota bacterium]|nr:ester cyclase [Chloroflexota bacterium]
MPSRGIALIVAGLLLAPSALAAPTFAQDATPSAECATTTEEENKEVVRAFFAAAAGGDGAGIADALAPDHVYHELSTDVPMTTPEGGAEAASEWANERKEAITDLSVTVDPIIADGDQVASMMHWSGTDTDTGAEVNWSAAGFFVIECGKISENW